MFFCASYYIRRIIMELIRLPQRDAGLRRAPRKIAYRQAESYIFLPWQDVGPCKTNLEIVSEFRPHRVCCRRVRSKDRTKPDDNKNGNCIPFSTACRLRPAGGSGKRDFSFPGLCLPVLHSGEAAGFAHRGKCRFRFLPTKGNYAMIS